MPRKPGSRRDPARCGHLMRPEQLLAAQERDPVVIGIGKTPAQPAEDNALISRAIEGRWPITADMKARLVAVSLGNALSDNPKVSNGAIRNLLRMDELNLQRDAKDNPRLSQSLVVHVDANQLERDRAALIARLTSQVPAGERAALLQSLGLALPDANDGDVSVRANGAAGDVLESPAS